MLKRGAWVLAAALIFASVGLTTRSVAASGDSYLTASQSSPTVGISRVGDLHDGGTVVVFGRGFTPNVAMQWFTCATGVVCDSATAGGAVTDSAGSFSQLYVTRRFISGSPEIDCANTACTLVGFEVPLFQSSFALELRFPSRFPRFQYRVEVSRTGSVDATGSARIGVHLRCSYITDFTIRVTALQRDATGVIVANGVSNYVSARCFPEPRRGRTVFISVDSMLASGHVLIAGMAEIAASAVITSTAGEPSLSLLRTVELK